MRDPAPTPESAERGTRTAESRGRESLPPSAAAPELPPALSQLERLAGAELARLRAALPAPPTTEPDPLLVTLAWDLGLSGTALPALCDGPTRR